MSVINKGKRFSHKVDDQDGVEKDVWVKITLDEAIEVSCPRIEHLKKNRDIFVKRFY